MLCSVCVMRNLQVVDVATEQETELQNRQIMLSAKHGLASLHFTLVASVEESDHIRLTTEKTYVTILTESPTSRSSR